MERCRAGGIVAAISIYDTWPRGLSYERKGAGKVGAMHQNGHQNGIGKMQRRSHATIGVQKNFLSPWHELKLSPETDSTSKNFVLATRPTFICDIIALKLMYSNTTLSTCDSYSLELNRSENVEPKSTYRGIARRINPTSSSRVKSALSQLVFDIVSTVSICLSKYITYEISTLPININNCSIMCTCNLCCPPPLCIHVSRMEIVNQH